MFGWHIIVKLCVALVLGGFGGGWQCRKKLLFLHPAICMAACFLVLASIDSQRIFHIDLSVAAAQSLTAAGLLGAVVIGKEQSFTKGLTTATSLWVVAAIGMAIGYAYYSAAVCTTVISYFTLTGFRSKRHCQIDNRNC